MEREQMLCHLTRTTRETHRLIQENLEETPVYGGWVDSKGPRYCPSIEDKIVRFKDKESHQVAALSMLRPGITASRYVERSHHTALQVFLEPEGRNTPELYVQGLSTGLPERLQLALLHTLPGIELNCYGLCILRHPKPCHFCAWRLLATRNAL